MAQLCGVACEAEFSAADSDIRWQRQIRIGRRVSTLYDLPDILHPVTPPPQLDLSDSLQLPNPYRPPPAFHPLT